MKYFIDIEKNPRIRKYLSRIRKEFNARVEDKGESWRFYLDDGLEMFKLQKVLDALKYGFEEESFKLLRDDYDLLILPIKIASKKDKERKRILSRIIGSKGKAKKNIEKLANVSVIVDDVRKEVALLGKLEDLEVARESVNRLIEGEPHGKVYSYLESYRRFAKMRDLRDLL